MALHDDPALQAALAESRQRTAEATRSLRGLAAGLAAERDRFKAESARRREEIARAARSGELGAEQQRIQRRVDAGQTTWEDVAAGRDDDPAAEVVRTQMAAHVQALREELEDDEEFQRVTEEAREAQRRAT